MTFAALGLSDELVRAVTERGYTEPTPIQAQAIPAVLPIAIILLICGLLLSHRILPAKQLHTREILPGVVLTVIVWVAMAGLFSAYLVNFNSFASTYASLSGLFAAMFFLYLAALVLILGGEVNRVLQLHRAQRLAAKISERESK